jgi:hypothetical protein
MPRRIEGSLATPALGTEVSPLAVFGEEFRLLTLHLSLTSSAVVANRFPHFQFVSPSGDIIHEVVPVAAQAASLTYVYDLVAESANLSEGSAVHDDVVSLPLPKLWFPPSTIVRTKTTALDVGDAWTKVYFTAEVGGQYEHERLLQEIADNIGA